ncbi:MAG TPA: hypothetical protein VIP46_02660 [Pyrinomonadaceae bacterium]
MAGEKKQSRGGRQVVAESPDLGEYVLLPIDEVLDDPANENVHTEEQIELLRASIRLYGQQEPVIIDRNRVIIAHHGVKLAMKLEGRTHVECRYSDLKGADRAGYRIAANATGRLSFFDDVKLRSNVAGIREEKGDEFHPELLGMGGEQFGALMSGANWGGPTKDQNSIGDYDPNAETYLIKIPNVTAEHKDDVLARIRAALEGTGYEAAAY